MNITVGAVTDLSAENDSATTQEDVPVDGTVADNDSTLSGGVLSFAATTNPANGSVVMQANGDYTYTPAANFHGNDSFTYTVTDAASGESLIKTVNITVGAVTDLSAENDSATTQEDVPVDGTVANNDSTLSGGVLSFAATTNPANGSVVMQANGDYTYTPAANFHGNDSFTYTVTDAASGESLIKTVNITVGTVTDLSAENDSATTQEDVPVDGTVADNDSTLSGGVLSFAATTNPANGSVVMQANGDYTYTPAANFHGNDSFTYTVTDAASGESLIKTVNITVGAVTDLSAENDSATTQEDVPVDGTVADNDSTLSGGVLSFAATTNPANGSVVMQANGDYTYTPAANFHGNDSFTYTVTDAASGESLIKTVNITVGAVTDLSAENDSATTQEDVPVDGTVADNDSTLSGGVLSFAATTNPANGSVVMQANGDYTYTPAANFHGNDSFTYTVTDAASGESLIKTVNITVGAVTDLSAENDSATTQEDVPVDGTVADNDSTLSGGVLSFVATTNPANGSVVMQANGDYTYTPAANFHGNDSFTYTVTDAASGESLIKTVNIAVGAVNDAPIIISDGGNDSAVIDIAENTTTVTSVIATDLDLPNDTLAYSISGGVDKTLFVIDSVSGELNFISAPDYENPVDSGLNNSYQVEVTVTDEGGLTDVQMLTVNVSNEVEAPAATDNTLTINEDTSYALTLADFGYLEGDGGELISITVSKIPVSGSLTLTTVNDEGLAVTNTVVNGDIITSLQLDRGQLNFIPADHVANNTPGNSIVPDFEFTVSDGVLSSTGNTLSFNVLPIADAPTVSISVSSSTAIQQHSAQDAEYYYNSSTQTIIDDFVESQSPDAVNFVDVTQVGVQQGTEAHDVIDGITGVGDYILAGGGNDLIIVDPLKDGSTPVQDYVSAGEGDDVILGSDQADSMYGGAGNDTFISFDSSGIDGIYGGHDGAWLAEDTATDVAVFSENSWEYNISTLSGIGENGFSGIKIATKGLQPDGSVIDDNDVYDIEIYRFEDGDFTYNRETGEMEALISGYNFTLDIQAALIDVDGSEILSVMLDGIPVGAKLHDVNGNEVGVLKDDGRWSITTQELIGLTLNVPLSVKAEGTSFTLLVEATSDEINSDSSASNSASLTINIPDGLPGAVVDNADVFEAGLTSGTDEGNQPVSASGNLLSNDAAVNENTQIINVSGTVPDGNGIITIDDATGTLTVYTQDYNGQVAGDYSYLLKEAVDHTIDGVETFNYTIKDVETGEESTASLLVNIVDDAPIGTDIDQFLQASSESLTFNLVIVLDRSGSMNKLVNGVSRMDIAKQALGDMFDAYDKLGNVNIQIVDFSSGVNESSWYEDDVNGASTYINAISTGGSTHYDSALEKVIDGFNTPTGSDDTRNLLYFISDGEPTGGHSVDDSVTYTDNDGQNLTGESAWESFVSEQGFSASFGIGIGDVSLTSLLPIAYPNSNNDEFAIKVNNTEDLSNTLLSTLDNGFVHGSVSVMSSSGDVGLIVGSDGGYLSEIIVDGQQYSYGGPSSGDQAQIKITTSQGAVLDINFSTGEYHYRVELDKTIVGEQEIFQITVTDNDGDMHSADLTVNLDYIANVDANRDLIITNQAIGGNLEIPVQALLNNDTTSHHGIISAVSGEQGGTVSLGAQGSITFSGGAIMYTYGATGNTYIESASDSEFTDINNALINAEDYTDRSQWGNLNATDKNGPSILFKGAITSDNNSANGHDQDFIKIHLLAGEQIWFDIDNNQLSLDVFVYNSTGEQLAHISENSAAWGKFDVLTEGDYYVQVQADDASESGSYDLFMTMTTALEVTNPDNSFDYQLSDEGILDQTKADIKFVSGTQIVGSNEDEILLGSELSDSLVSGAGDDYLIGGAGADSFVWLEGDTGTDHIQDFNVVAGDVLDLSDLLHINDGDNLNDFLDFDSNGQDTTINVHANGDGEITQTIVLDGVDLGSDDVTIINDMLTGKHQGALFIGDDSVVGSVVIVADLPDENI